MYKVSIIIPNYNGVHYLKECLDSLDRQTFTQFEIIVIDNASTDGSVNYLKNNKHNIKLIEMKENLGFSIAVNMGIKNSLGDYVVLMNNDTVATETWLEKLVSCIEKEKEAFSCSSKMIRYTDKNIIDDAGDGYTILGWSIKYGDGKDIKCFNKNREVFSSCGGAAIYRKSILSEIGLFDENFFAYFEDLDLSYRARIFGYKNLYCSNALIYHIGSGTSGSRYNEFKAKLSARNNIYLIYKNMPIVQVIVNLPFIIVGYIVKTLFYYKKGLGKSYFQGIIEGISTLRKVDKVKFHVKNIKNYFKIEYMLIKNTFYFFTKIFNK